MPVKITTESASDLTDEMISEFKIDVIPMNIIIDGKTYKDKVDLNADEMLTHKGRISTSANNPEEYKSFFSSVRTNDCDIIHISLSSKLSSAYQNACIAAKSVGNVHVVDSLNISAGTALLCIIASQLASSGESVPEIVRLIESKRAGVHTSFILEDLERMKNGGRCTAIEVLGANLLGIKPSVEVVQGRLCASKRYYGRGAVARLKFMEKAIKTDDPDKSVCFLYHSLESADEVRSLKDLLETEYGFERVFVNHAGCCTSAHCGRNCMGLIFLDARR